MRPKFAQTLPPSQPSGPPWFMVHQKWGSTNFQKNHRERKSTSGGWWSLAKINFAPRQRHVARRTRNSNLLSSAWGPVPSSWLPLPKAVRGSSPRGKQAGAGGSLDLLPIWSHDAETAQREGRLCLSGPWQTGATLAAHRAEEAGRETNRDVEEEGHAL